jgi:hypothetical protein
MTTNERHRAVPGAGSAREAAGHRRDAANPERPTARPDHPARPDDTVRLDPVPDRPTDPDGALAGGLGAELTAAAPRRWWNRTTVALGVAALLTAGFLAGAHAQREYGEPTAEARSSGRGGAAGSGFPGGYGFPGGVRPSGAAGAANASAGPAGSDAAGSDAAGSDAAGSDGAAATGTVKLVDGTTIYVQTADGSVVTVRTSATTEVSTARKARLGELKAGDRVTVRGQRGADGTVTAAAVTGEPE